MIKIWHGYENDWNENRYNFVFYERIMKVHSESYGLLKEYVTYIFQAYGPYHMVGIWYGPYAVIDDQIIWYPIFQLNSDVPDDVRWQKGPLNSRREVRILSWHT